jgi:ABC-type enterochelin transport system substrate-binding protein
VKTPHTALAGFILIALSIGAVGVSSRAGGIVGDQSDLYAVAAAWNSDTHGSTITVEPR